MGDGGQEVGVSSRVIVSNNQVCRLATRGGMTVMIRSWEPRLRSRSLKLSRILIPKRRETTIQKSVFHEGRGVTERSGDETMRGGG